MKLQEIMKKIETCNKQLRELFGRDKIGLKNHLIDEVTTFSELKRAIKKAYIPDAATQILDANFGMFNGEIFASYSLDEKNHYNISFYVVGI